MQANSLTERTIRGFLWLFTGRGVQAILQIVIMVVLARLLTPAQFGVVSAGLVVIGFSQIFSELGIGAAIVQRKMLTPRHLHVGFTLASILGVLIGIVIALSASAFARFFQMPDLYPVIRVLAVAFPIVGLSVAADADLKREMRFRALTVIHLISYAIGYGVIGITLASAGFGVWALVIAYLSQATINTVILLTLKPQTVGVAWRRTELAHFFDFGAGYSLARIANYAALQIDNLVVGRWLGAEALGIYSRAYQFLMAPTNLFGSIVNSVLFPAMSTIQDQRARLAHSYTRALALVVMLTLPLGGILIVLAPEIVLVVLGTQWVDTVLPFQVFAAILVFRTGYKISDTVVRATGRVYRNAWRQLFYALSVFCGAWIGQAWGVGGVALGVSLAVALHFFMMLQLCKDILALPWRVFSNLFLRHLSIAGLVSGAAWGVATVGRLNELPALFVLLGGGMGACMLLLLIFWLKRGFFGEEGNWLGTIGKQRMQPLLNRLTARKRAV